jgi:hypothetical protein
MKLLDLENDGIGMTFRSHLHNPIHPNPLRLLKSKENSLSLARLTTKTPVPKEIKPSNTSIYESLFLFVYTYMYITFSFNKPLLSQVPERKRGNTLVIIKIEEENKLKNRKLIKFGCFLWEVRR